MALRLADINGNPYIGVFCRRIGDTVLCPMEATEEFLQDLSGTLEVRTVRSSLGGTNLHGSLVGANSKGFIVPYFYDLDEVMSAFRASGIETDDLPITGVVSDDPHTAWGNNILVTERTALVNPDLRKDSIRIIQDTLDVEVVTGTIAGVRTVGSVAAHNSKGMVVHPKVTEEETEMLKHIFGLDVKISTANFGSPYLGASIIANDKGALVGNKTSGVEMNRIENTLDLI